MRTYAKRRILAGSTSVIVEFSMEDSTATTGAGKTGLVYTTGSPLAYYSVDGGAPVAITLATMVVGTWASGGFVEMSSANAPGLYQLGIPNAALASGKQVDVILTGFTGASPVHISIDLIAINEQIGTRPRGTYTKRRMQSGSQSVMVAFPIESDAVTVAEPSGKTGLAYNTGGITIYASTDGAAAVQITPVTMTVGTWASGGFKEISSALMPGMYLLGIPNAILASGAQVDIVVSGMTGAAPAYISIDLVALNEQVGRKQF